MPEEKFVESREEMEEILRQEQIGYLGLLDGGIPYVVPLNYAYVDGRILFHGSLSGRKMDCLRADPTVCFTVGTQPEGMRSHGDGNPCHVDSDSVICYGRAREVVDLEERRAVLNEFNHYFRPDAEDISVERAQKCAAVEILVTEMTGRREREKQTTYWRCTFRR